MRHPRRTAKSVAMIGTRGYPSFYGGFETAVRRLAPHLADRGWRVRVYGRPGGARADAHADERVEQVVTRGVDSTALSTLTYGFTAAVHAIVHKPDVALIMNVANGFWLPLLRLRRIPTVVNVDGIEWERDKWSRLGKLVFRLGARMTARFADELVFDAEAIGDYWRRHFNRDGRFIPYGGDPSDDLPLEEGLRTQGYVLMVARFVPENSVGEFLDAAPRIAEETGLDVVLVGGAPAGDPLQVKAEQLAAANDRVHLAGRISDDARLFALWQHAAVYFHGHTVGGTNPALVQAMALGARIVARETVYNCEVLDEAGVFCGATPDSIAAAVWDALADPRPLETWAKERALESYGWPEVLDRYDTVLTELAGPSVPTETPAHAV